MTKNRTKINEEILKRGKGNKTEEMENGRKIETYSMLDQSHAGQQYIVSR